MKSSNNFNKDILYSIWGEYVDCKYCGKNGADCFHHGISRARKYTDSIYNAIPLHNYPCHLNNHGWLVKEENAHKLIIDNIIECTRMGYKAKENDKLFLMEYGFIDELKELL